MSGFPASYWLAMLQVYFLFLHRCARRGHEKWKVSLLKDSLQQLERILKVSVLLLFVCFLKQEGQDWGFSPTCDVVQPYQWQSVPHQLRVLPANLSQYAAARQQQGASSNSRTSFSLAIPGGSCSQLPQFRKLCWGCSLCKFGYFQLEGNGVLIVSRSVSKFNQVQLLLVSTLYIFLILLNH